MTLADTGPILEIDRLLDRIAAGDAGPDDSSWTPTLHHLRLLDRESTPPPGLQERLARELLDQPGSPPAMTMLAPPGGATVLPQPAPIVAVAADSRPVPNRWPLLTVASAAVLLLALVGVTLLRPAAPPPEVPYLATNPSAALAPPVAPVLAERGAAPPTGDQPRRTPPAKGGGTKRPGGGPAWPNPAASGARLDALGVDLLRAGAGGWGTPDLVDLLARGADDGHRALLARQAAFERDLASYTDELLRRLGWDRVASAGGGSWWARSA